MSLLDLKPQSRRLVMNLVQEAGLDTSDWANFKGGENKAASNPKYCYEWSYRQGEIIILNLWHENLKEENGTIFQKTNLRKRARSQAKTQNEAIWKSRATKADDAIQTAYKSQKPLRIIICDGIRRKSDEIDAKASQVHKRLLDPVSWAVTSYDENTGDCTLTRGVNPVNVTEPEIPEDTYVPEGFEGEIKKRFITHRRRERHMRDLKIREAQRLNNGHIICEVPRCGFDFLKTYGALGAGYAEVHHKYPLSAAPVAGRKVTLDDLAVVCSNCHAMIHRNGDCRDIETLIPTKKLRKT